MFENLDFTQDIKDNLLIKPVNPALNPQMPTLQQQASQAMGLNTQLPQVNAYPTGTPAPQSPQPQQPKSYATRYAELLDTLGIKSPQVDMQRAEKLKKQAQWNSMGNVLSAIFSGYMGSKGAPILNTTNEYVPAAMGEYEKMLAQDKENTYRDNLMRLQMMTQGINQDIASEQKASDRQFQWDINKWEKDQQYRNQVASLALQHGYNLEELNIKNKADMEQLGKRLQAEMKMRDSENQAQMNQINASQGWMANREAAERKWKEDFYKKNGQMPGAKTKPTQIAGTNYEISPKTHVQIKSGGRTYDLKADQVTAMIDAYNDLRNSTQHSDWDAAISNGTGKGIKFNSKGQADLISVANTAQTIYDKLQEFAPNVLQQILTQKNLPGEDESGFTRVE